MLNIFKSVFTKMAPAAAPDADADEAKARDRPNGEDVNRAPEMNEFSIEKKQEIVSYVKKKFEKSQQDRQLLELQWIQNINFIDGNQYCCINPSSKQIEEIAFFYEWEERAVYNQLATIYETRLAKLSRMKDNLGVRPATSDRSDIATAKVCKGIVRGTARDVELSRKIGIANAWMEKTGTVFYKQIWNNGKGEYIGKDDESGIDYYEGAPETVIVPAFEIFPASLYKQDIEIQPFIIHVKPWDISDIREKFGVDLTGKTIDAYCMKEAAGGLANAGYFISTGFTKQTKIENQELVYEYYENPSARFPEGRLIIVAGDKLVHYQESLPYHCGKDMQRGIPIVKQCCLEVAGEFFGDTIIRRCIPLQQQYNAVKNRKTEHLNRLTNNVLMAEAGTLENLDEMEEKGLAPGSVVEYNPNAGHAPQWLQSDPLPASFDNEEYAILNDLVRISGVSELAKQSQAPTGVGSGIALDILREQDDTRLSLTANQVRDAIKKVGAQWLRMYKEFSSFPRVLRWVGNDNAPIVYEWESSDITSDDVIFETESELNETPAQRKQTLIDLLQYGALNNPKTGVIDRQMLAKIKEAFMLGDYEEVDNLDDANIRKANYENLMLDKGVVPKWYVFDDHTLHFEKHLSYRLSNDFTVLEEQQPELAIQFETHILQHYQSMQEAMNAVQQGAAQPLAGSQNGGLLPAMAAGQAQPATA